MKITCQSDEDRRFLGRGAVRGQVIIDIKQVDDHSHLMWDILLVGPGICTGPMNAVATCMPVTSPCLPPNNAKQRPVAPAR